LKSAGGLEFPGKGDCKEKKGEYSKRAVGERGKFLEGLPRRKEGQIGKDETEEEKVK